MDFSFAHQMNLALLSLATGLAFGLMWDICAPLCRRGWVRFLFDVLLLVLFGGWNFLFLLYWLGGFVRMFVFMCEGLGVCLYYLFLHAPVQWVLRLIWKVLHPVFHLIKMIAQKIGGFVKKTLKCIGKKGYNLLVSFGVGICSGLRLGRRKVWKHKKKKSKEKKQILDDTFS